MTFTVPSTSTNGSYRVQWSDGQAGVVLMQAMASGHVGLGSFPPNGFKDFTNQPAGSYTYYLRVYDYRGSYTTTSYKTVSVVYPPSPPGSITVAQQGADIAINWTASPTPNVLYKLYRSGQSSPIYSGSARTFLDTNVNYNTSYTYSVKACVGTNCSAPKFSSSITVTPLKPSPPSQIDVKQALNRNIIGWSESSSATHYLLRRNGAALVNNVTEMEYTDGPISSGVSYVYSVAACNANGCSSAVFAGSVTGGVPNGAGSGSVRSYEYDALSRLVKVKVDNQEKTVYQYDDAGNRTTVEEK